MHAGIAFTDITKKIAELWKELSAEDKAPYEEKAKKDKERYGKEMEAYKAKQASEPAEAAEADADAEAADDDE